MAHYYKLYGKLAESVIALHDRRVKAVNDFIDLSRKMGAKSIGRSESSNETFAFVFDEPPDGTWRRCIKGEHFFVPKRIAKNKKLVDTIEDLENKASISSEITALLDFQWFHEGHWHSPGSEIHGGVPYIIIAGHYKPPKRLANQIERVSDVDYEDLTKPKKIKRKK